LIGEEEQNEGKPERKRGIFQLKRLARISHRPIVDLGESGPEKSVERPSFLCHNYVIETGYGRGKGGLSYDRV